jgi:hypothetical protein
MKKNLLNILSVLGIILLIINLTISCNKDNSTPEVNLDVTSLAISSAANSADSIIVTSNTNWAVTSSQKWLTVSPVTGSHDGIITVAAEQNSDSIARTATITVTAEGVASQTVTVTQYRKLTLSTKSLSLSAAANSTSSFIVISDTNWTVTSSADWLTVSPPSGSNKGTITVKAPENKGFYSRDAKVNVSENGKTSEFVSVTQDGAFTVSATSIEISGAANSIATFTVTYMKKWSLSCSENWLRIYPKSGSNVEKVTIVAMKNRNTTARTAKITISTEEAGSITITITQKGT